MSLSSHPSLCGGGVPRPPIPPLGCPLSFFLSHPSFGLVLTPVERESLSLSHLWRVAISCWSSKISFSGPLASFVGKNFDTRQDACWGQLRDEAVCSPSKAHTRQIGGERGWWWVRRGERGGTGDCRQICASDWPTFCGNLRLNSVFVANQIPISSPDSDFSLSGHVPLARPPK